MWFRVGGYHYSIQNNQNIYGVQANIEAPLSRNVSLIVQNNYDNQNDNRFSVGLRASFGGSSAPSNTIESRMMDPIIRHQARQSYGEATPKRLNFIQQNEIVLIDNGWFFSPNGSDPRGLATTINDCTAENPCNTIDSETALRIQQLDPQANLLFETGTYLIPENSPRVANLWDGQRVLGRTIGWFSEASGAERPEVLGGLFWGDASDPSRNNATGYIENMSVTNRDQTVDAAVSGLNVPFVVAIGATGSLAVYNTDSSAVSSVPINFSGFRYAAATGVFGSDIIVDGGSHQAIASIGDDAIPPDFAALAFGINGQSVSVKDAFVSSSAQSDGLSFSTATIGAGDVLLQNTDTQAIASGDGAAALAVTSENSIRIEGGTHRANSNSTTDTATAQAVGSFFTGDASVEVNHANTFATANSVEGDVTAIGISGENMTVIGGSHEARANSSENNSSAFSIGRSQSGAPVSQFAQVENANTFANATSGGVGDAEAQNVVAADAVTVVGGSHGSAATAESGDAIASNLASDNAVSVQNATLNTSAFSEAGASASNIQRSDSALVETTDASASATSVLSGDTLAINVLSTSNVVVTNGTFNTSAMSLNGESLAGNFFASPDLSGSLTVTNANTSSRANSGGSGDATAFNLAALGRVTVNGGSYTTRATSVSGNAIATSIGFLSDLGGTLVPVTGATEVNNANTSATATSETGDAFAIAVSSRETVTVTGGFHQANANSEANDARALSIFGSQRVEVSNAQTRANASSATATGDATAFGVSGFSEVVVSGGSHRAESTASNGQSEATGISSIGEVHVGSADPDVSTNITAVANDDNTTAVATGVQGGAGPNDSVINSTIEVDGNGTNNKCVGVEMSDGSCS